MKADKPGYEKATIQYFLKELARESPPLPAAGSAAALAGALSASLDIFAARLTLHKGPNPSDRKDLLSCLAHLKRLQKKCLILMNQDTEAYQKVIQGLRRSKAVKDKTHDPKKAFQKAMKQALVPPLKLVEHSLGLLRCGQILIKTGPQVIWGDISVAVELAYTCLRCGLLLTLINLGHIDDPVLVKRQSQHIEQSKKEGERLYRILQKRLENRIGRK